VIKFKVIDIIGYSGSGKTFFITKAIKLFRKNLNYNIAVIKNVKHHPIDNKGKDSYLFREVGASYSVIQNRDFETAIFFNKKEDNINELLGWLEKGPNKIDLLLTEGFRDNNNPTVLCASNLEDINEQLGDNIKMISGLICQNEQENEKFLNLPIIDIENNFINFLDIFNIH